jgi:peptidoglycan/LPS O-acetylase OafA/YrhL
MGWGKSHEFVVLDGLRGIAAIAVVTRHAWQFFPSEPLVGPPRNVLVGPFYESYLAVDFFFLLSGFVLAHAYGNRLKESMSIAQFMAARLIRLYPLYFLGLATSFVLAIYTAMHHGPVPLTDNIVAMSFETFFLPAPVAVNLFPLNLVSWSLFFELIANLLFAISWCRINAIKLIGFVGACAIALIASVSFGWLGFGGMNGGAMADGFYWGSEWAGLLRALTSFSGGVLIYEVWQRRPIFPISPLIPTFVLTLILIANPLPRYAKSFDLAAVLVVFPLIVLFAASLKPRPWLANICVLLGTASYGVYVLELPISDAMWRIIGKLGAQQFFTPGLISGLMFLTVLLPTILLVDRYYDVPLRRKLSSLLLLRP